MPGHVLTPQPPPNAGRARWAPPSSIKFVDFAFCGKAQGIGGFSLGLREVLASHIPVFEKRSRVEPFPVWKWIAAGVAEGADKIANLGATPIERINQLMERIVVAAIPFGRNRFGRAPHVNLIRLLGFAQRRLK